MRKWESGKVRRKLERLVRQRSRVIEEITILENDLKRVRHSGIRYSIMNVIELKKVKLSYLNKEIDYLSPHQINP